MGNCEQSERTVSVVGIRDSSPGTMVSIQQVLAPLEPASLASRQIRGQRPWITDQAEQEGEIHELAFGNIVDLDRASLDEDRSQEIGTRNLASCLSQSYVDRPAPAQGLGPPRHANRSGRWGGLHVGSPTHSIRSQDIDPCAASPIAMPDSLQIHSFELETRGDQHLGEALGAVLNEADIHQDVGIQARAGWGPALPQAMQGHHLRPDQGPGGRAATVELDQRLPQDVLPWVQGV